jgi:hypothetical protein
MKNDPHVSRDRPLHSYNQSFDNMPDTPELRSCALGPRYTHTS